MFRKLISNRYSWEIRPTRPSSKSLPRGRGGTWRAGLFDGAPSILAVSYLKCRRMNGTQRKSGRSAQNGSADEVREVLDCIRRIVRLLRLSSREAERELGLTGAQLFVLQKLTEAKVLSVNELAERTHTHQSSVSVVAQSLVDKGLVSRARASDDARRLELTLTPAARSLMRKAPGAAQDRLIDAFGSLSASTRSQLSKSLCKLVDAAGLSTIEPVMIFEDNSTTPAKSTSKSRNRAKGRAAANARR
jgi:MarR family transcriptional regulator, lower aerobic nicotinate degradation pathway regulator